MQLKKRTLPMRAKPKSDVTLGEAFAKKNQERKPRSNPFGSARPVDTASKLRSLSKPAEETQTPPEPVRKPRANPFGAAKPVATRNIYADRGNASADATNTDDQPKVEVAAPADDADSGFGKSFSQAEADAPKAESDEEEESSDEDLPVAVQSIDLVAPVSIGYTPDVHVGAVATAEDDTGSSQWETSQKKEKAPKAKAPGRVVAKAVPKNSRWSREAESNDSKKPRGRFGAGSGAGEQRRAPPAGNSRWNKKDDAPPAPPAGRVEQQERERSPPKATNSRWAGREREEDRPAPTEAREEKPPQSRNSRWARSDADGPGFGGDNRRQREREEEPRPPQQTNSRWSGRGDEREGRNAPMQPLQAPVARNSRWADDREQKPRAELQPPVPTQNSRFSQLGNNDSPADSSRDESARRSPPVASNSRWAEGSGSGGGAPAPAPAPVKREKTDQEKKLDARIAAIRAKNANKGKAAAVPAGVPTDPFGRPITGAARRKKPTPEVPSPKAAPAVVAMVAPRPAAVAKPVVVSYCTTIVSEEDMAAYKELPEERMAKLKKITKGMLNEYMQVEDHNEVKLCMDDLKCPAHYKAVVTAALNKALDCFKSGEKLQKETDKISKLMVTLREKHVDGKTLADGLNEISEQMDDLKIDLPRAPQIFKSISSHCLKLPGLLEPATVAPATWACAGMSAPKPEGCCQVEPRLLELLSTGAVGDALTAKVAALKPAVSGPALMAAVFAHLASKNADIVTLLEKDEEDDSLKFAPFEEDNYGSALDSVLTDQSPADQKLAVNEMQLFAFEHNFPTGLVESLFMTAYDEELIVGDAYFLWMDDSASKVPGRIQARKDTLAWCTWCKENDDDEDDDSEDDE